MTAPPPRHLLRIADLRARGPTDIVLEPGGDDRAAIAETLGISALKKLRFSARLIPSGKSDWALAADLGATVVQPCVVTLEPVTTRIDEVVSRRFLADWQAPEGGSEVEMPDEDDAEPLPDTLDLYAVAIEALALALPPWPRAEGVDPAQTLHAAPGVAPMTDDDARPFAGLAGLRDRLAGGESVSGTMESPEDDDTPDREK